MKNKYRLVFIELIATFLLIIFISAGCGEGNNMKISSRSETMPETSRAEPVAETAVVEAEEPDRMIMEPSSAEGSDELAENEIVRLNQFSIKKDDFMRIWESPQGKHIRAMSPPGEAVLRVLQNMIDEEAIYQQALEEGLDQIPEIRAKMEMARKLVLYNLYRIDVITPSIEVTDAEVDEMLPAVLKEVRVRILYAADEETAGEIRNRIEGGADFGELAGEFSVGPARQKGGDIGFVRWGSQYFPAVVQAKLFSSEPGYLSPVFQTELGYAIAKLEEVKDYPDEKVEELKYNAGIDIRRRKTISRMNELISNADPEQDKEALDKFGEMVRRGETVGKDSDFRMGEVRGEPLMAEGFTHYLDYALRVTKITELTDQDFDTLFSQYTAINILSPLAEELGLEKSEDYKGNMENYLKKILQKKVNEIITAQSQPDETELLPFYEENLDRYHQPAMVKSLYIRLDNRDKAEEILRRLENGEDFGKLAGSESIEPHSAERGGNLGPMALDTFPARIGEALGGMSAGETSPVLEHDGQFHVFRVLDKRPASSPSFEEIRPRVAGDLNKKKREKIVKEKVGRYLEKNKVMFNQELLHELVNELKEEPSSPEG